MQMAAPASPDATPFSYDHVRYPGHPFVETHPGHLATLGAVFGMQPARLAGCRVLELGCGEGNNLIPLAFQWPESEFVGIDLSAAAVDEGNQFIARMGLSNVTLRSHDIMDIGAEFGQFDYIVSHGVYSWVPDFVREKILAIFRANLAPHGVGYISYNCYPGCHARDIARGIMRYHVRDLVDPRERTRQARALMQFLAQASAEDTIYGFELRNQLDRIEGVDDRVLFHDDLSEVATPFYLHEVVEAAARHGLQYLADSAFAMSHLGRFSPKAREHLATLPEDDVVTREQYMDFVEGRSFRHSLFCQHEVKLTRRFEPRRIVEFHLATSARHTEGPEDPAEAAVTKFKTENGSTLATDHRLSKAMIRVLGARFPQTLPFAEALELALAELGAAAAAVRANLDEEIAAFGGLAWRTFSAGQLELHWSAPRLTASVGPQPEASRLARRQAESGLVVTNLRHRSVSLKDDAVRRFLMLVDGTRDVDRLLSDLSAGSDAAVTREGVEQNLRLLAKLGLLVPQPPGSRNDHGRTQA